MLKKSSYEPLFDKLGYTFSSLEGLSEALTHASASRHRHLKHNERLEFLGDRVVGLILADLLFKQFPNSDEGELAKRHAALVSRDALLKVAKSLALEDHLKRSASFAGYGQRHKKSSLSDACEAVMAALYLDGGYEDVYRVVERLWAPLITQVQVIPEEPKSRLQEWAQGQKLGLPQYYLESKSGLEHEPLFKVRVSVGDHLEARGAAPSKREAERRAAQALLEKINEVSLT